jgi:hypothetical protein
MPNWGKPKWAKEESKEKKLKLDGYGNIQVKGSENIGEMKGLHNGGIIKTINKLQSSQWPRSFKLIFFIIYILCLNSLEHISSPSFISLPSPPLFSACCMVLHFDSVSSLFGCSSIPYHYQLSTPLIITSNVKREEGAPD